MLPDEGRAVKQLGSAQTLGSMAAVPHFESRSGGTRGRPTRIRVDLEHAAQSAPHWALWFAVPAAPSGLRRAGLGA